MAAFGARLQCRCELASLRRRLGSSPSGDPWSFVARTQTAKLWTCVKYGSAVDTAHLFSSGVLESAQRITGRALLPWNQECEHRTHPRVPVAVTCYGALFVERGPTTPEPTDSRRISWTLPNGRSIMEGIAHMFYRLAPTFSRSAR